MAVKWTTPQTNHRMVLSLITLAMCRGVAAQPASQLSTATAPAAAADPLAAPQRTLDMLEHMRVMAEPRIEDITRLLQQALSEVEAVDHDLDRQLALLEGATPPARRTAGSNRGELVRTLKCRAALMRGDAWRFAAGALKPSDPQSGAWLDNALKAYRGLRLDFRDLPAGLLGYVGESRVHRQRGQVAPARAALTPVLDATKARRAPFERELSRIARIELLETLLLENAAEVAAQTRLLRRSPEFAGDPAWQGRIDWLLARAVTDEYLKRVALPNEDRANLEDLLAEALGLLRSEPVASIAPPFERFNRLAKLDESTGQRIMSSPEVLAWAGLLAGTGRPGAADWYERARRMPGEPLPPAELIRYAGLLWKKHQHAMAASLCEEALERKDLDAGQRSAALQLQAIALAALYQQADQPGARDGLRTRALGALGRVIAAPGSDDARRDALRRWVEIQSLAGGAGSCVPLLEQHKGLIRSDGYLLYALSAGQWEQLRGRIAASSPADGDLAQAARSILEDLLRAQEAAMVMGWKEIAARTVLLRSNIHAATPLEDKRSALQALTENESVLASVPAIAAEALRQRVTLLVDLGLSDAAEQFVSSRPVDDMLWGATRIQVAEALAQGYASTEPQARASLQQRVVALCQSALSASVGDAKTYALVGQRAARCMLDVRASAAAQRVLEELLKQESIRSDRSTQLACSLMLAEALSQENKLDAAVQIHDRLAREFPDVPEVLLARGRFEMSCREMTRAVESLRRARATCQAGSLAWCEATLSLAEAFIASGRPEAAAEVLRVSSVLYPEFGSAELRTKLRDLQQQLPGASVATK